MESVDVLVLAGVWLAAGVAVAVGYGWAWQCWPRVRHVALWPLVLGHMFWARDLPEWAAPAPLQREACAVRNRLDLN